MRYGGEQSNDRAEPPSAFQGCPPDKKHARESLIKVAWVDISSALLLTPVKLSHTCPSSDSLINSQAPSVNHNLHEAQSFQAQKVFDCDCLWLSPLKSPLAKQPLPPSSMTTFFITNVVLGTLLFSQCIFYPAFLADFVVELSACARRLQNSSPSADSQFVILGIQSCRNKSLPSRF